MMKELTSYTYSFEELIQGEFLYVDKTEYIWNMIRPRTAGYFLSRPRRFGKSLTVSTLKAIFQGKKELFNGLAISEKDYDWKPYPVIHLDMNGLDFSSVEELESSLCGLLKEAAVLYGLALESANAANMFRSLINQLAEKEQVVILVDEYDKPILNNLGKAHVKAILDKLKQYKFSPKSKEEMKNDFQFLFEEHSLDEKTSDDKSDDNSNSSNNTVSNVVDEKKEAESKNVEEVKEKNVNDNDIFGVKQENK